MSSPIPMEVDPPSYSSSQTKKDLPVGKYSNDDTIRPIKQIYDHPSNLSTPHNTTSESDKTPHSSTTPGSGPTESSPTTPFTPKPNHTSFSENGYNCEIRERSKVNAESGLGITSVLFTALDAKDNLPKQDHTYDSNKENELVRTPVTYMGGRKRNRSFSIRGDQTPPTSSHTSTPSTPRLSSSERLQTFFAPSSPPKKKLPSLTSPRVKPRTKSSLFRPLKPKISLSNWSSTHDGSDPSKVRTTADSAGKLDRSGGRIVKVQERAMIEPGEVIMAASLDHVALNTSMLATHCSGCLLRPTEKVMRLSAMEKDSPGIEKSIADKYKRCSRCQTVVFCSLKCYAQNAAAHYPECRALSRCEEMTPDAEVRLLAKVFHARAGSKRFDIPGWLDEKECSRLPTSARLITRLLREFLVKTHDQNFISWKEYGLCDEEDATRLVMKLRSMIFPLKDGRDRSIGWCLSRLPAQINHSCSPNAYISFPNGVDVFQPLRVISLDATWDDDEITVSYVDQGVPCHLREGLLEHRGFEHDCEVCIGDIKAVDLRWAARHEDCVGNGIVPLFGIDCTVDDTPCTGCKQATSVSDCNVKAVVRKIKWWYEDYEKDMWIIPTERGDYTEETKALFEVIAALEGSHPDTLYPLPHLRHRLAALTILSPASTIDQLKSALKQITKAYTAYRDIYKEDIRPINIELLILGATAENQIVQRYTTVLMKSTKQRRRIKRRVCDGKGWSKAGLLASPQIGAGRDDKVNESSFEPTKEDDSDTEMEGAPSSHQSPLMAWISGIENVRPKLIKHLHRARQILKRAREERNHLGGEVSEGDIMEYELDRLHRDIEALNPHEPEK